MASVEQPTMDDTAGYETIQLALAKCLDPLCRLADRVGRTDRTRERMFFGVLITMVAMSLVAQRRRRINMPANSDVELARWKHAGVVLGVLVSLASLVQGLLQLIGLIMSMV